MTPESFTSLETLGEIAVTIMGFTGLVTALQMRGRKAFVGPSAGITITLFIVSGLVVFACFLPGTLYLKLGSESDTWTVAFQILFPTHLLTWLLSAPFIRQSGFLLEKVPQPDRSVGWVLVCFGVSATVTELLVVLGLVQQDLPFVYRSILLTLVVIGMGAFVLVLFALDRDSGADS